MGIKRIVSVLVAGVAVAATSQVASAQSSNTEVLAFRGFGATAVFRTIEGCITTEVIVVASETSAPAQPTGRQNSAAVLPDRRNTCTGEVLLFGSGSGLDVQFHVGPLLSSAEVHGVVPVHDVVADRTLDVAVDVVWTGVGQLERGANHSYFVDDGVVVRTHSNGSFRNATAVGHVVADTTELVPAGGSTDIASLAWSNDGQVLINRGA